MATQQRKDVELGVAVNVTNADRVDALTKELKELAAQGKISATDFERLTNELKVLATQTGAVDTLAKVESELKQTTDALTQATTRSTEFAASLADQRNKTQGFLAAQLEAAAALRQTKNDLIEQKKQLDLLNNEYDRAGKSTVGYTSKARELKDSIATLEATQKQQALTLKDANKALTDSTKNLNDVESATKKSITSLDSLTKKSQEQTQAFAQQQAAVSALGVESSSAATAQNTLAIAIDRVNAASAEAIAATTKEAAAKEQAAIATKALAELEGMLATERQIASSASEYEALNREAAAKKTAASETKALADAEGLLATERELAAAAANVDNLNREAIAKQALAAETKALADLEGLLATERELAAAAAQYETNALVQEAAAAERAAQAIRDETVALQQQAQALRASIDTALGSVGVRSAQALRAEINQVRDSMGLLRSSGELTGKALQDAAAKATVKVAELELQLRQVTNQTTFADRLKLGFGSLADGANSLIARFGALGASIAAITFAIKPFFDTAVQLDSMRRALTAVSGSAADAERSIAFLRDTAKKSGLSIGDISDAFVRFSASAKASGISTQVVQDVFRATALAAGNLGISSDKLSHILDALAQMANKGVVSMEELRQQLGDSLPGALGLLAKGLGITEQQLVKLVETGKLLTVDALPALAEALTTLSPKNGQVDGLSASFNNLKNAITETTQVATQGDGFNGLVAVLKLLGVAAVAAYTGVAQLLEVITTGITTVFRFGEAITTFSTGPLKKLSEESQASYLRIKNLGGVFSDYVNKTTQGAESTRVVGDAMQQTGQQASAAAGGVTTNAQAHDKAAASATANTIAQQGTAAATKAAGTAAQGAIGQWYALSIAFDELNKKREQEIVNAEQYAKAAKIEGDTRQVLAKLAGDEALAVQVAAKAGQLEAEKLAVVSNLRKNEVDALIAHRDSLISLAQQLGDPTGTRAKEIDKINETIKARQADSEKATQQAESSRLAALSADTAAKAYADNAAKLDILRTTYEQTTRALNVLIDAQKAGLATQGQVDAARERAAVSESLYRDALKDSTAEIERKLRLTQASISADDAGLRAKQAAIDTEIAWRKALNDTSGVHQLTIDRKKIDLQISQDKLKAQLAEIEATKQEIARAEQLLKVSDPLYQQKKDEIDLRRQNVRAKEAEANAQRELIRQQQLELQISQTAGPIIIGNTKNATAALEQEIAAQERLNDLKERQIALENKRRNVDADGFTLDSSGNRLTYSGQLTIPEGYYFDSVAANKDPRFLKGLTDGSEFIKKTPETEAKDLAAYQALVKRNQEIWAAMQGRSVPTDTGNAGGSVFGGVAYPAPTPAPAPAPAPAPSTTHNVNLIMGGATTTIGVSSEADAQTLIDFLQQLQSRTS